MAPDFKVYTECKMYKDSVYKFTANKPQDKSVGSKS